MSGTPHAGSDQLIGACPRRRSCRIKEQFDAQHTCKRDWKLDDVKLTEDQVTRGRNREQVLKDAFWAHGKTAQGGEWAERRRAQMRKTKRTSRTGSAKKVRRLCWVGMKDQ